MSDTNMRYGLYDTPEAVQQSHPGPAAPLPSRHSHHHHLPASAPAPGHSPAGAPAVSVTNKCHYGIALTPANVLLKIGGMDQMQQPAVTWRIKPQQQQLNQT